MHRESPQLVTQGRKIHGWCDEPPRDCCRRPEDVRPTPTIGGEIHSLVDSNRTDGEDDDWPRFRECEWNWHCFWIPSPEVRTSRFECPIPSTRSACDSDPEELKRKDTYAMRRGGTGRDSKCSGTHRYLLIASLAAPVTARTVIIYVTGNYGSCETIDDIASELSCMASTVEVAHGNSAAKATFTLKPPVESDRFVECLLQTYKFDYYGLRDDTNTRCAPLKWRHFFISHVDQGSSKGFATLIGAA